MRPKITDIVIEREKLDQQFNAIKGRYDRKTFENKIMCNSCDQYATKLIKTQVGDSQQKATRIERYYQKHFELIIDFN